MNYEGMIYRPPSEAYSLILQVTVGCAHNSCTFCTMYKEKSFHVKPLREVEEDLKEARDYYGNRNLRIFLADGDALVLSQVYDFTFVQTVFSKGRAHYFLWNRAGYFAKIEKRASGIT